MQSQHIPSKWKHTRKNMQEVTQIKKKKKKKKKKTDYRCDQRKHEALIVSIIWTVTWLQQKCKIEILFPKTVVIGNPQVSFQSLLQ